EGELDRAQHVLAPVLLGILLRVGVLEGKSIGRRGVEGGAVLLRDVGGEVGVIACLTGIGTLALDQVHRVVLQIVRAGAASLVGVGDRATVLEAPFAGGRNR